MYITRLKLINFIGIKNGMNKNEIEIYFPKKSNIITMISGKNGSGKSTIMSQLTPFKDSFDDRKSLIIPGKEGIKEIDIEHNGHTYKIKHVYSKTSSSFIEEDGVELNENGGVRTFEEIIYTKFKLSKEYFKVGKIGSNTSNFIQFNTTERKKYISTFVEAVEKYIKAFEIVNKKAKVNSQQIKQISDDLKKLGDVETLKIQIQANDKSLNETNLIINQTNETIGRLTAEIDQLNKTLENINYNEEKSILKLKENLIEKNKKLNAIIISKYGELNIEECADKINKLTLELDNIKTDFTELNTSINSDMASVVTNQNEILKVNAQMGVSEEINLNDYKNKIDRLSNINIELNNKISANPAYSDIILKNKNKILVFLDGFKNFMLSILSYYDVLNSDSIQIGKRNAELFFKPDFSSIFGTFAKMNVESINANRELLDKKKSEYSEKSINIKKLDILEKRPKECKIDSCPFIADALQYANLPEELQNLESAIKGISSSLEMCETKNEELSDIKIAYSNIAKAFKILNPRENIVYAYFISKYGKISQFTKLPYNEIQKNKDILIEETENIIQALNDIEKNQIELDLLKVQYEKMLNTEKTKLFFQKQIIDLEQKNTILNSKIEKDKVQLDILKNKQISIENSQNELESYLKSLNEMNELNNDVIEIRNKINIYEKALSEKTEKEKSLNNSNQLLKNKLIDRENITNAITAMKANEITIQQYNDNLKNIKMVFNDISSVKNALDPKSGIPLVFIKSYLDGTEAITNELLNIAFNGKFEIKFVPTASDFFIQVRCGDNVIEDIKLASQGELSLTTISISLALIERSIGEYNIVYLDEIDGPLDKDNRESFIHIIEKQIAKLGLEQIFVISHNNAFEDCAMNLILLNGSPIDKTNEAYMNNKKIIYDVDE